MHVYFHPGASSSTSDEKRAIDKLNSVVLRKRKKKLFKELVSVFVMVTWERKRYVKGGSLDLLVLVMARMRCLSIKLNKLLVMLTLEIKKL